MASSADINVTDLDINSCLTCTHTGAHVFYIYTTTVYDTVNAHAPIPDYSIVHVVY